MNPYFLLLSILPLLSLLLPQAASLAPQNKTDISSKNRYSSQKSIKLLGDKGRYYTGNLTVGIGRMEMRMLVDSSSSDTWFASTWCTGSHSECGTRRYDCNPADGCYQTNPDLYKTKLGRKQMNICYDYPTGCIEATVSSVLIRFEQDSFETLNAKTVGMLNYSSDIFYPRGSKFDGLMGLGRSENLFVVYSFITPQPFQSPFQQLLQELKLSQEFYVYLNHGKGSLDLGSPDSTHYRQPLETYIGASQDLWMLLAQKIEFGNFQWYMQPCEFNTGWPYIGIPKTLFEKIMKELEAVHDIFGSRYLIKCPHKSTRYPTFQFTFNGNTYDIDQKMYINPTVIGEGYCQLLLDDSRKPYWILGIPWFEQYYTGFSFPGNTISIAQSV